jgi:hypothetical protein
MKFIPLLLLFVACNSIPQKDLAPIPSIQPTTYYIADEEKESCKGKYFGIDYDGSELSTLRDLNGKKILEVCSRLARILAMEGTAIMKDRGNGRFTLNWAAYVEKPIPSHLDKKETELAKLKNYRFKKVNKCIYGEGYNIGITDEKKIPCLLPFYTIASEIGGNGYTLGDIVYIPKARGVKLPDGTIHDGFFEVRDAGGPPFAGKGKSRVDLFVFTQNDNNNVFLNAKFETGSPMGTYPAYLVSGKTKEQAKLALQQRFGSLY